MVSQHDDPATAERLARAPCRDAVFDVRVDSVRELWRELETRSCDVGPVETQDDGVDGFGLRDPDGDELGFTSPADMGRSSLLKRDPAG